MDALTERIVDLAASRPEAEFETIATLAADYPGDPGIVISLLLNHAVLKPGESIFLPAGNTPAYLFGLGIELMGASDNVLRGGLTPTHVDVPELLSVLDFTPVPVPMLKPIDESAGVTSFRPPVPEFELAVVVPDAGGSRFQPAGDCLVLVVGGALAIAGSTSSSELAAGAAAWVTADEGSLAFSGNGTAFVASVRG